MRPSNRAIFNIRNCVPYAGANGQWEVTNKILNPGLFTCAELPCFPLSLLRNGAVKTLSDPEQIGACAKRNLANRAFTSLRQSL